MIIRPIFSLVILAFSNIKLGDACNDLITACHSARFTCKHPVVGHIVRRNCPKSCKQQCSSSSTQKLADHPSCHTWAKRKLCKGRLEAEMSVYCPNECKKRPNGNGSKHKTTKSPNPTNPNNPPKSQQPKYPLWAHSLDESLDVCGSFYDFTCAQYQRENRPTKQESFGRLTDHIKLVRQKQSDLIFENSSTQSTAIQTMRQFRDKCLDESDVERLRTQQLIPDLKAMGDFPMLAGQKWNAQRFDLTQTLIKLGEKASLQLLFEVGISEAKKSAKRSLLFTGGDLLIKQPEDYLDTQKKEKVKALKHFLVDLMQILASDLRSTQTYASISQAVNEAIEFEKQLAKIYVDLQLASAQQLEDALTQQHKLSDLKTIVDVGLKKHKLWEFNKIQWDTYFQKNPIFSDPQLQQHIQSNPDILMLTEDLLKQLNSLVKKTDPKVLANYLLLRFVVSRSAYLDARFSDAARRFAQQLDGDTRRISREDNCMDMLLTNFPLVVDYLYTNKWMTQESQAFTQRLWSSLKTATSTLINQQQWLTTTSKTQSQQKLQQMTLIMGSIDEAKNQQQLDSEYSKTQFKLGESFLKMAEKLRRQREQGKFEALWSTSVDIDLSKKRKDDRWRSGSVNAYLAKRENKIFIPTAILHEPLYDSKLPDSANFGSLGFVIAQVMMHAFDGKGAHFNGQGKKHSIWDKQTKLGYKSARFCLYDKYGSHAEPQTGINVDAKRTMRNNLADGAGIRLVFEAYKLAAKNDPSVPGYSQYNGAQSLFISYGATLCASLTKEVQTELIHTSPYSPNFFRVNIVLANYPQFQKTFNCKSGSRMIANPSCSLW